MSDWPVKVGVVCLLLCVLLDLAKANASTGELVTDEHSDYSAISEKRNRIVFLRENPWKLPPEDESRLLSLELLSRIDVPSRDLVQRYLLAQEYAQAKMLLSYSELKDSPQLRALYWSLELLADDEQMPFAMQRLNDCQRAFNSADCAELLRVMSARNLSLGNFNEAVDFSNAIEQVAVDERSALLLSQDRRRFFKAMLFSGELRVATRTFVKALVEYRKADVPEESIINLELDWVDYTLGTDPVSIGPGAYLSPNTILASAFRRIAQLESPAARYQQVYRYIVILGQLGSNPRAGYAGKPLRKARAMLLQLFGEMSIPQDHQALGFVLLGDSFVQNRRYDDAQDSYLKAWDLMSETQRHQYFSTPTVLSEWLVRPEIIYFQPGDEFPDETYFSQTSFSVEADGTVSEIATIASNVSSKRNKRARTKVRDSRFRPKIVGREFVRADGVTLAQKFIYYHQIAESAPAHDTR